MIVAVTILQIIIFAGWIIGTIWLYFDCRKKVELLTEKYNFNFPFRCKTCSTEKEYTFREFLKIIAKPRNEVSGGASFSIPLGSLSASRTIYKEYRFLCPQCNQKRWQIMLLDKMEADKKKSGMDKEHKKIMITFIAKAFALGIFAVIGMTILMTITDKITAL
ncbi:Zn finger protein HypA/HybF involved in hydrogenase expression [Dysgonomonas sp. PFB1-18]|uniref:hypothetical protein n=1 Tax=unclassified Dysgonomonas TaxID=2630389 RepID=UPI002473D2CD|nr:MULTISPECIES: hypothetical protein [unclassified Dysgonomonas]MDH6309341.1 Zn finger protein HypA/HybF involved in hydrogenase expression [Dysgonomonas sp. PF1-14]MDH6339794.1 Zn finger protein HypA/HybF involved in hydrogenase expression [Dysgonomonas sp. PF1-16]MDH6381442.1 Zn finger protein HypA/HybF involved in hydrogenase expression [Dysgonomonas sp. PFB1-18]MDH6398657.1 Zn finger protein HypA/HybF involved in hydrogenase expression [Dysgonomonas sp. PF1-23]